jgi:hypothetical protein
VRREPGASPSSLLRVAIRAKFRDVLRGRGGAGIRDMLRRRSDETANFGCTLMERSGSPLAAVRRSRRNRRRLGARGPPNPSRLGPPTSGRLSGGVGCRPGLNSHRQSRGGVIIPQPKKRRGRRQEVPSSLRGHRGHGAAPGPLPAGEGARPPRGGGGNPPRGGSGFQRRQDSSRRRRRRRDGEDCRGGGQAPPLATPSCSRAPQRRQKP